MKQRMTLKGRLRQRLLTVGSWITLAHPAIAEIMAKAGFDWLVIDLEHSVITIREAEELIRIVQLCGVDALVRLSSNDSVQIKRVMDAGASGIVVPMVNTVEEAKAATAAASYPPKGFRGVGLARAQGYGNQFASYVDWAGSETVVIVQVEHKEAVKNLREILSVDGVDGFIVGPYDLSGSLGIPGVFDHPLMKEAMTQIHRTADSAGKAAGIHVVEPDIKEMKQRINEGYNFLAYSLDIRMLDKSCRAGLQGIRGS